MVGYTHEVAMERAEFERTYPKYCRKCLGWGMFKTMSPDIQFCDCKECIGKGNCPRCSTILGESHTCAECGWDQNDGARGLPGSNVV